MRNFEARASLRGELPVAVEGGLGELFFELLDEGVHGRALLGRAGVLGLAVL